MIKLFLNLSLLLITFTSFSQANMVKIKSYPDGFRLTVNNQFFMVNGMNWDYIPIGTNTVDAGFWGKSDEIIKAGLDIEMSLLKNMNVNAIRQYTGVPPRWIEYIYENYGIYTMLNHSFGRYGLTLNGVWTPVTIYDDEVTVDHLMSEITQLVEEYKDTPGLLLYLLGNENNYGLFWQGSETEDFPDDEQEKQFIGESRGRPMYKLMNEAAKVMKAIDKNHPVAICNGDVLFIDIIAEECKDVDIFGTNTYRGASFTDMFDVVKAKLNMPLLFTEFGSDAFNAKENREDQKAQAYFNVENWREIYENAAGLGKTGISIGGFTFQFSDGWWKFGFDERKNANKHDPNASWANSGYGFDFVEGQNNMNEEWFGICAKGPTNERGLYELYPRAAYYALKEVHQLNPYDEGVTAKFIDEYFNGINIMDAVLKARGDEEALIEKQYKELNINQLKAKPKSLTIGNGCKGDELAANTLPVNFEGCESFISTFSNIGDSGVTTNLTTNPNPSGINTSDNVLRVIRAEGINRWGGIQNSFPPGTIDITTKTFKVKVYSILPDVTYRFELASDPQLSPEVDHPAPVFRQVIGGANQWIELEFTFINLPATSTTYNQLVIKPDNPDGTDAQITNQEQIFYFDDIRLD